MAFVSSLVRRAVAAPISTSAAVRAFSSSSACMNINITFVEPDGTEHKVVAQPGQNMLELAHENDIDIEGACGGEAACSTCHVILDQEYFDKLPEAEEEEEDMLDLALGLTDTSRLGCQVVAEKELDGMVLRMPAEVASMLGD